MKEKEPLTRVILFAIALAMSVATIVLSILGEATPETVAILLGIGFFCVSVAELSVISNK
jgi:hypothetical protein